jgi:hypothetical protein
MATYLERYVTGEHKRVWDELWVLGERVREEPLYTDAFGVARETILRARHNIKVLIPRLKAIGYEFGYAWAKSLYPEGAYQHEMGRGGQFILPSADTADRLRELEGTVGLIPLSIRAWFEAIGEVDFVGRPPRHWGFVGSDQIDESGEDEEYSPARNGLLEENPSLEWCSLDPLCIWSIDSVMAMADPPSGELETSDPDTGLWYLPLMPDPEGKYFISGSGPVGISVPSGMADAEFVDGMPFVDYLRLCFRCGGLPGLRDYLGPMDAISEDLQHMTHDLLPL